MENKKRRGEREGSLVELREEGENCRQTIQKPNCLQEKLKN